jgi:hypothetical protein
MVSFVGAIHESPLLAPTSMLKRQRWTFYETINPDDLVKSHLNDGFVKSSRCKARKN